MNAAEQIILIGAPLGGAKVSLPTQLVGLRGHTPRSVTNAVNTDRLCRHWRNEIKIGKVPVTEIQIAFANYYVSTDVELTPGNACAMEWSLELTSPSLTVRGKFSGVNSGTMSDGLAYLITDPIPASAFGKANFSEADELWVRSEERVTTVGHNIVRGMTSGAEVSAGSSGATSQIDATGPITTPAGGAAGTDAAPILAVLGRPIAPVLAVWDEGDSIADFFDDVANDLGRNGGGYMGRSFYAAGIPVIKSTVPGSTIIGKMTSFARRKAFLDLKYCNAMISEPSINDLSNGATPANILTALKTLWGYGYGGGCTKIMQTLTSMKTLSTSGHWTSLADQNYATNFGTTGNAATLRTSFLAEVGGAAHLTHTFDPRPFWSDPSDINMWMTTGVSDAVTDDGLHPQTAVHLLAVPAFTSFLNAW